MLIQSKKSTANLKSQLHRLGIAGLVLLGMLILGLVMSKFSIIFVMAGVLALFLIIFMLIWPDLGTMFVVFMIYTNLAVVAYKIHGLPQMAAASVSLTITIPLAVYLFIRREKPIIDYSSLLMVVLLACLLISSFVAIDVNLAFEWIITYILEGLMMYFLLINVIRNLTILRKVIWVLLIAGGLLGGLTLLQEITGAYKNDFGGLAQRNISEWSGDEEFSGGKILRQREKVKLANRAGGPIGGPNRYAQIMIVLLPLALFRFWDERSRSMQALAMICGLLILSGMLLTYSRGAFVALALLLFLMTILRYIRFYQLITTILLLILIVFIASPGYLSRMETIQGVQGLFTEKSEVKPDAVTRGRLTEMLAAFMTFLDHPVIGVGPGQYSKYYSVDYMNNPEIAFRQIEKTRSAHTMYFELMAETGILGFSVFMAIVLLIMYRLWKTRKRWSTTQREIANYATAFWLAIVSYLGTAVFLQLSFQRYYWLLLALAGATIQILNGNTLENNTSGAEIPREDIKQLV